MPAPIRLQRCEGCSKPLHPSATSQRCRSCPPPANSWEGATGRKAREQSARFIALTEALATAARVHEQGLLSKPARLATRRAAGELWKLLGEIE